MLFFRRVGHHLDDLAPAGDEIGEKLRGLVRQDANRRPRRFDEAGDDGGVDRIGLGAFAERLCVVADLRGIDDDDRQAGARQARGDDRLEAAGRFHRDQDRRERLQSDDELRETFAVAGDRKRLAAGMDMHIQPILRHVDADVLSVHPIPSLRNRASLRAAQATVRVRWNGGQRPSLSHGLGVPQGRRSLVRHRSHNYDRVGVW